MALSELLSDPAPPPPPPCGVRNTGSGEPIPTPSSPPARRASDAPAVSSSSPAMAKPTVRLIGCAIVRRASHACARAMRSRGGEGRAGTTPTASSGAGEKQHSGFCTQGPAGAKHALVDLDISHVISYSSVCYSKGRDVILVSHAGFDRRASPMKRTRVRSRVTLFPLFSGQHARGRGGGLGRRSHSPPRSPSPPRCRTRSNPTSWRAPPPTRSTRSGAAPSAPSTSPASNARPQDTPRPRRIAPATRTPTRNDSCDER